MFSLRKHITPFSQASPAQLFLLSSRVPLHLAGLLSCRKMRILKLASIPNGSCTVSLARLDLTRFIWYFPKIGGPEYRP